MFKEIFFTILWSISPLGEAKVGIPYGLLNDVNPFLVLGLGLGANILVFPIMIFFLESVNSRLWHWRPYKKIALWIAQRAKRGSGDKINKFGFWGLMFFVSLPIPGTGVYAGTIASHIFRIKRSTAFLANSIGITISSLIVWTTTYAAMG